MFGLFTVVDPTKSFEVDLFSLTSFVPSACKLKSGPLHRHFHRLRLRGRRSPGLGSTVQAVARTQYR